MQTVIQVIANGSGSLRDRIVNHPRLEDYDLYVAAYKKQYRPHGWAKLCMYDGHGALNIEWHASTRTLIARVVTRGGRPGAVTGAFVSFLVEQFSRHITAISVVPSRR
jgi:hypothetical protein